MIAIIERKKERKRERKREREGGGGGVVGLTRNQDGSCRREGGPRGMGEGKSSLCSGHGLRLNDR